MIAAMKKITNWISHHNPKWLALVRVALGATLLLKGKSYLDHIENLQVDIATIAKVLHLSSTNTDVLSYAFPWIHIVGGFLIMIGLLTRFASILQAPIILAVIALCDTKLNTLAPLEDLPFAIVILLLLVIFIIEGSGKLSLSWYIKEADGEVSDDDENED